MVSFYEGKSVSNQPFPFPVDRDTQDFHALFQYVYVLGLRAKIAPLSCHSLIRY